ncbi:hypothetical protein C8Q78DRAFT_1057180 [Trametes maxima]|nr:hypothetical protein C8Q78DRAFT_1057180 [Trametes maxima]
MFSAFITSVFAFAFLGQSASATPFSRIVPGEPTDIAASFPIVNIHSAVSKPNVTLPYGASRSRLHADVAIPPGTFPATLLACSTENCISCIPFDMSTFPHNTCLAESFNISSVAINQPSDQGLPFGVFVGSGCTNFIQIPGVNQCFTTENADGTPIGNDIAVN